jgi:hypothetical protein
VALFVLEIPIGWLQHVGVVEAKWLCLKSDLLPTVGRLFICHKALFARVLAFECFQFCNRREAIASLEYSDNIHLAFRT